MTKYVIMNLNGKPVQTWTFSNKPKIIYCQSFDWTLKSDDEKMMRRQLEFLKKHFPNEKLRVMRVTVETTIKVG